jgi:predicted oxidoreductase
MQKIKLNNNVTISQIIHGHWRLDKWDLSKHQLANLINQCIEIGITTFDHADIYGNYTCENIFGEALKTNKNIRNNIQIITKCGVKLAMHKFPDRKINTYDYSYDHIISSVENSLRNFNTDYIDLLLLHRPAPLLNPNEVAKAFNQLINTGKVLSFGVSNFTPYEFSVLQKSTDHKLVTNQIELSPYCLEHFENHNIDFLLKEQIRPMAWSPIAGGKIMNPIDKKSDRIHATLKEIANELNIKNIDTIIYSWLLKHPIGILPIVGSGKISRIKNAVDALNIQLTDEQWYRIYIASTGVDLP